MTFSALAYMRPEAGPIRVPPGERIQSSFRAAIHNREWAGRLLIDTLHGGKNRLNTYEQMVVT